MEAAVLVLLLVVLGAIAWLALRPQVAVPDEVLSRLAALEGLGPQVQAITNDVRTLRHDATVIASTQRSEAADRDHQLRNALIDETRQGRTELAQRFEAFQAAAAVQGAQHQAAQKQELDRFGERITQLSTGLKGDAETLRERVQAGFQEAREAQLKASEALRAVVEQRLELLQRNNDARLEAMQKTVDEKLQSALETKLTESFKTVSAQLEAVHKGLGEMRELASNVGDLKKVMTNVKTRGTWGEVLLGNLLEEVLPPDRFERNWAPPRRSERVEFAIKLPGNTDDNKPVFLPIDAKFPKEDYERLQAAADAGDAAGVQTAQNALYARVTSFARDVRDKYLVPPHTTDFAILFLPTEGLYAEVLREPALVDKMQRELRVILAGPTTLLAILNSLQMGFRTLALQKKSAEISQVLAAVKTEFGKFEEAITAVHTKIVKAAEELDAKVGVRTRKIAGKLRAIEAMPEAAAQALFEGPSAEGDESP